MNAEFETKHPFADFWRGEFGRLYEPGSWMNPGYFLSPPGVFVRDTTNNPIFSDGFLKTIKPETEN